MPTLWDAQQATLAIIKNRQDFTGLLVPIFNIDDSRKQNRHRLDLLFKSSGDGYWDWYIPTANVFFSDGWKQMLGYDANDIDPSFKSWVNLIHPDDLGNSLTVWSDYMDNTLEHFNIEHRVLCKNNGLLWVEAHGIKDLNSDGEIVRLAGFHRNLSERKLNEKKLQEYQNNLQQLVTQRTLELKQANQKLEELSHQDSLTLLQNRRGFDSNLEQQLRASKRYNTSLCILLMGIDHFKFFNDEYGHQQGDTCLKMVASRIKQSIHCPADMAARYGGEEFVIILQDTDIQGGIEVAKKIQKNIAQIKGLPINTFTQKQISLSIEIAFSLQTNNDNLVNLTDKAMYKAKSNGRDQICYYSDDLKTVSFVENNPLKK